MFKCKSCQKRFGANLPEKCPDCGQPMKLRGGGLMGRLLMGSLTEVLVLVVVVALVWLALDRLLG